MKICSKCKIEKEFQFFTKSKQRKDGLNIYCKECEKERKKIFRLNNIDKVKCKAKQYRDSHKNELSEKNKIYNLNNKLKKAENGKKWRIINKLHLSEIKKIHYLNNKEKYKDSAKKWKIKNPQYVKNYNISYRLNNPEKRKEHEVRNRYKFLLNKRINQHNRRQKLKNCAGILSKDIIKNLYNLQKGLCVCCKNKLGNDYHLDHIMPLALGGTNTDDNLQLLKAKCNLIKNSKHPIDYMQSKGFLL